VLAWLALAVSLVPCLAAAQPATEPGADLRAPAYRSTRQSAYSLPKGTWALELGALGMGENELYGQLGASRGFGAGIQLDVNLAHYSVGLFNFGARWNFLDTRHLALSFGATFIYGHGDWMWFLGPLARELVKGTDLYAVPINLRATVPVTRWLQFDLGVGYQYAKANGSIGEGRSFYAKTMVGASFVAIQPSVRLFLSNNTALELSAALRPYTRVPYEGDISGTFLGRGYQRSGSGEASVSFSKTWNVEVGVRTRITPWFFCSFRLAFGPLADLLFDAYVYPAFALEFRF
jgi:hypothetical protein